MSDSHDAHGNGHDSHGDDHKEGHADAHSGGHEEKSNPAKANKTDPFFDKVSNYVTGKIATFVAFLFALISVGAIYAVIITGAKLSTLTLFLVLAPAIVGLIAYYNRDMAIAIFILFFVSFLLI